MNPMILSAVINETWGTPNPRWKEEGADPPLILQGLPEGTGWLCQCQDDRVWLQLSTGGIVTEGVLPFTLASARDDMGLIDKFISRLRTEHEAKFDRPFAGPYTSTDRVLHGMPEGTQWLAQWRDDALILQLSTGDTITEMELRPTFDWPATQLRDSIDSFITLVRDAHKAKLDRPLWHDDCLPTEA